MKISIGNSFNILLLSAVSFSADAWRWGSSSNDPASVVDNLPKTRYIRGLQRVADDASSSTRVKCLDNVVLLKQTGETDFPMDSINIVSQDTSNVTVSLNQMWSESTSIDHIYTYYQENRYDKHCYENTDVQNGGVFDTITITCNVLTPKGYLEICVADDLGHDVLSLADNAEVPKCCHPTFPSETPAVCYTLEISCVPECDETTILPERTEDPTVAPTKEPTKKPTMTPTSLPTDTPTKSPTASPTKSPTVSPTPGPTIKLTKNPTTPPTESPTKSATPGPTIEPTKNPTTLPTKSPTPGPTIEPTKSPTSPPTKSPTKSPTTAPTTVPTIAPTKAVCEEKMVSDVCIAIDNSGSICTNPGLSPKLCDTCRQDQCQAGGGSSNELCCGNYQSITSFASSYVDSLPSDSTFSILKYGSEATVIAPFGSSPADAKDAIETSAYTGGYTHTEDAILKCVDQLKESKNPVIVLITDGTPTVCNNKNNNGVSFAGRGGCNENKCNNCNGNSFANAAESAASLASNNGATLIPVVISSVSTDIDQLEDLARCPANSGDSCNVDDYKGLTVENLDDLDTILDDLVKTTECAGTEIERPNRPDPTDAPTRKFEEANTSPPEEQPPKLDVDCDRLQNLGFGFSEATGNPHYSGKCYPSVVGLNANNLPGRDDSVAVFVGGSYYGKNAAEVEGNMVVLGDLKVDGSGPGNFVSVGVGTHVLPNSGGECIKVGGSISASRDIQVFKQASSMYCDIVYKGSASGKNRWKTNGEVRQDPDLNLAQYEMMKSVWERKSKYWATLPSTGTVDYEDWGNPTGQTTYQCTNKDEVQVFNVLANQRKRVEGVHTIYFSNNCEGKTILINVHGGGKRNVDAAGMHFKGKQGYGNGGFENCLKSSILWNFPDADTVDIGNGKTSEFQGSLLITGNLEMTTTGQSGRTIVLGDIIHNRGGSEFHSYEYNPPKPLPDPEDICVLPSTDELNLGTLSTSSAMEAPPSESYNNGLIYDDSNDAAANTDPVLPEATNAPTSGSCTAIPQNRLPKGSSATRDNECNKCKPPNNVKWYPCNKNPPLCEGNCVFNI